MRRLAVFHAPAAVQPHRRAVARPAAAGAGGRASWPRRPASAAMRGSRWPVSWKWVKRVLAPACSSRRARAWCRAPACLRPTTASDRPWAAMATPENPGLGAGERGRAHRRRRHGLGGTETATVRALHEREGKLGDISEIGHIAIAAGPVARAAWVVWVRAPPRARRATAWSAWCRAAPCSFVAVPVRAPVLLGWVVMGFPIDQALVDDMNALSGLQVALLTRTEDGEPARWWPPPPAPAATRSCSPQPATPPGWAGENLLLRRVPLAGEGAGAQVVLLRSIDEAVASYSQLRLVLGGNHAAGSAVLRLWQHRDGQPHHDAAAQPGAGQRTAGSRRLRAQRRPTPAVPTKWATWRAPSTRCAATCRRTSVQIRQLAYWDRLTGLPNRAQFRDAVHGRDGHQPGRRRARRHAPRRWRW